MRTIWLARHPALFLSAMAAVGCDDGGMMESKVASRAANVSIGASPPAAFAAADAPAGAADDKLATAGRKIIYNAYIDLVTEDLGLFDSTLAKLIGAQRAYIADSMRTGSAGSSRRGMWKVRIPVEGYDAFVKAAVALGELVSVRADSQDVSEEYYDLDARQVAKKVEEARLLKHLTESTGKLEDILAVERELSRVRIEIERMQGRLKALANLTALATVTVTASEIKGYVPPQAPTLGMRIGRTFAGSVGSLGRFGESLLLACVAAAPWLPIFALGAGAVAWLAERAVKRYQAGARTGAVPPPNARG